MYKESSEKPNNHRERLLKDFSQKMRFYLQKIRYLLQGRRTDLDHLLMDAQMGVGVKVSQVKVGARWGFWLLIVKVVKVVRLPPFLQAGAASSPANSFSVCPKTLFHELYSGTWIVLLVDAIVIRVGWVHRFVSTESRVEMGSQSRVLVRLLLCWS